MSKRLHSFAFGRGRSLHGGRNTKLVQNIEGKKEDARLPLTGDEAELQEADNAGTAPAEDDFGDMDLLEAPVVSDTEAAVLLLRQQCPRIENEPAIILLSQVYTIVNDRTAVDRQLDALKRECKFRIFKLFSGTDDYAILTMEDYAQQIKDAKQTEIARNSGDKLSGQLFVSFMDHVVPGSTDICIHKKHLVELLEKGMQLEAEQPSSPVKKKSREATRKASIRDGWISKLMHHGLITKRDGESFYFKIPMAGLFLRSIGRARREVLSLIARKKYKEIMMKELMQTKLRYTSLDVRFVMRDLLGMGMLEKIETTSGPLLRIVAKEPAT